MGRPGSAYHAGRRAHRGRDRPGRDMIRALLVSVAVTTIVGCGSSAVPTLPSGGSSAPKAADPFKRQPQPALIRRPAEANPSHASRRMTKQDLVAQANQQVTLIG